MPYKFRNDRRHKFDKVRYKITNWPKYNEALKTRGSVSLWFNKEIIKSWYADKNKPKKLGGQLKYSDLAIEAALLIKTVYHLPYRATEGFLNAIVELMGIALDVPDYTRICRRSTTIEVSGLNNISSGEDVHVLIDSTGLKIFGQGQWHEEKHGLKKRREWRKLHLVIDRNTQAIVAQELTTHQESDDSQVKFLLETIKDIAFISGDTAYDTDSVYQVISEHSKKGVVIAIPPRPHAALSRHYKTDPNDRDHNILFAEEHGRYRWQSYSGYHERALAETAMFRYKVTIGEAMYSRKLPAQKVESKIACIVLNKMAAVGMPASVKIKAA